MKKILFSLLASLLSLSPVQAQRLVAFNRFGTNWASTDVSTKNKPNGYMYRLRKDVKCDDLPRVPETERLRRNVSNSSSLSLSTSDGWASTACRQVPTTTTS